MGSDLNFETPGSGHNSSKLIDDVKDACAEAVELTDVIKGYEDAIKAAKSRLHWIRTIKIPEAMGVAGIGDIFSLDTGETIKLSQFVSGSLPKEKSQRDIAFSSLISIGGEALIKSEVKAVFGKGKLGDAEKLAAQIESDFEIDVDVGQSVHPQTLQSFIREKLSDGEDIELEPLGLHVGTIAKIVAPKDKS